MLIFSGTANKPLAEKIAKYLNLSVSPIDIHIFPDGEKRVRVLDRVVDKDCIVAQPTSIPVEQNYMELVFIVDALKRSGAKSVTAIIPYLGYQRQDHVFRDGEAVSLEVVIRMLESVGVTKVITFDLHSIKILQVFKIPVVHLSALELFAKEISVIPNSSTSHAELVSGSGFRIKSAMTNRKVQHDNGVLVSPDMGGIRRIKILSELLDTMPYIAIEKDRDLESGNIESKSIGEKSSESVRVKNKIAFIVDDMIASGGTLVEAAKLLQQMGAEKVFVFVTHPVFTGNAPDILQNSLVEKVFVTDTIDVPAEKQFEKLEIISVGELIANELSS